jgi:oligopeptide/dipeptide ABC transporter ATP-binding protein
MERQKMPEPLVEVRDVSVHFPMRGAGLLPWKAQRWIHAVDGVTFDIRPGEILAMVGESGCGKTTLGKAILKLIAPTRGKIFYQNEDLTKSKGKRLRNLRKRIQLIFQDPYESLDPRQSIFDILAEPLRIHFPDMSSGEVKDRVYRALESTGLYPAQDIASRYPHHLSGGQRQRAAIAAAMILEPEFIVTDEPVSMLDVSIRAEILRLMLDLKASKGLTYLFITHDLSLAWLIADRIMVLYLGKVVEIGEAEAVIHQPRHPYTQALVSVIPLPQPVAERQRIVLEGEIPSPTDIPPGCRFHTRCWLWQKLGRPEVCLTDEPQLVDREGKEHSYACHFAEGDT